MHLADNCTEHSTLAGEEFLVNAAKRGDHLAYGELSGRHTPMIFNVVNKITRNREDTEDALQDTLMKAFIHLPAFDGRSSFSTWMTRIAINSALMLLRKRKARQETSLESENEAPQYADSSPGPDKLFLKRESEVNLTRAILRLPKGLREVVDLRNSNDASVKEVARRVGISVAATKSRLLRARRRLAISMTKQSINIHHA